MKIIFLVLTILQCTFLFICGCASTAGNMNIDNVTRRYERLYELCKDKSSNRIGNFTVNDTNCYKVYRILAGLYFEKDKNTLDSINKNFATKHPILMDSAYITDYKKLDKPKFDKAIKTYEELISIWGKDKWEYRDYLCYALSYCYSENNFRKTSEIIDTIIDKYSAECDMPTMEYLKFACYLSTGQYDTAKTLLNQLIEKYKNTEMGNYAIKCNENFDNFIKYQTVSKY